MRLLNAPGRNLRKAFTAIILAHLMVACDNPGDLLREVEEARAGCTEELLKAGDEICVRMFERYADMAADGMETYIGGMRAFDEAMQRRGGLLFDTAGLGSAIGGRWSGGNSSALGSEGVPPDGAGQPGYDEPAYRARMYGTPGYDGRPIDQRAYGETGFDGRSFDPRSYGVPQPGDPSYYEGSAAYPGGTSGPVAGGRWSDPPAQGSAPLPAALDPARPGRQPAPAPSASPARRGVLLPPEERLRRPWIDGADSPDQYLGDEPRSREPELGEPSSSPGWGSEPYPAGGERGSWGAY